jgi:esterase/lipase superfamily enzyme
MPTPNLYARPGPDPFAGVSPAHRTNRVDLLYLTDRGPEPGKPGRLAYGSQRSAALQFGSAEVEIGRGLSWGELVAASRTQHRRRSLPLRLAAVEEFGRYPPTPLPLREEDGVEVEDPDMAARALAVDAAFQAEMAARLARSPRKEVLVYVHGYNTGFEKAAQVLAGLWHFLGRDGVPVLYSWPAGGRGPVLGYPRDRESGEFTVFHLKQCLRRLAACPGVEKVHLLAHSRGADVVITALRELALEAGGPGRAAAGRARFGHVILAAPDLDLDVAQQRLGAERVHRIPERFTFYVSANDAAIGVAEWVFGSTRRLGHLRPEDLAEDPTPAGAVPRNVSFIDTRARSRGLGHSYFYLSPAVSSDLILLLRDNLPPGQPHGRPLTPVRPGFWILAEGYPPVDGSGSP